MHHNNVLETPLKESTLICDQRLVIFWFNGCLQLKSLYYFSSNGGYFKSLRDRVSKCIVIRPGKQAQVRNVLSKPGVLSSLPTSQDSPSFFRATSTHAVLLTHPQWDRPAPLFNSDDHTAGSFVSRQSCSDVHLSFCRSIRPLSLW